MPLLRNTLSALLISFSFITGGQAMAQDTTANNKQLLADFGAAVFANKDLSTLSSYMREDYIQHNPLVPQGFGLPRIQ